MDIVEPPRCDPDSDRRNVRVEAQAGDGHREPSRATNTRVRCHLGIQIPSGDCGIEVGGERGTWQTRACLVLNDHLEHSV
jgi:aspartyl/asparaginyl beta-hydroxylase (cupin superfamily)